MLFTAYVVLVVDVDVNHGHDVVGLFLVHGLVGKYSEAKALWHPVTD